MTGCSATPDTRQAKHGDTVQVHYTGKLADGTVFDSSEGLDPFEFTLGADQVIFGFEKAVSGMKVGEKRGATIPADEAYGPHTDDLVAEISRAQIGDGVTP
ncbi:MAG: FKBP-type peptidyl-prolyl cis-trans isomerase, partial [Chloroflexota bacterium]